MHFQVSTETLEITIVMEDTQPCNFYLELGLHYKDIKSVLSRRHVFYISERYLNEVLSVRGHHHREAYSDLFVDLISNQLQTLDS